MVKGCRWLMVRLTIVLSFFCLGSEPIIYLVPFGHCGALDSDIFFSAFAEKSQVVNWDGFMVQHVMLKNTLTKLGYKFFTTFDPDNVEHRDVAQAFVFYNISVDKFGKPFLLNRALRVPKSKLSVILWEPPIKPFVNNFNSSLQQRFGKVLTWDDELLDCKHFFKFYNDTRWMICDMKRDDSVPFEKKRLVAMVASIPYSVHPAELTSLRRRFIEYVDGVADPNEFGLYGRGLEGCRYRCYRGAITKKCEGYRNFKFAVCYENCRWSGYISEKIFEGMMAGCVPIYYGAPNITKYIPKGCFIDYADFGSEEKLYAYIKNMGKDEYMRYIKNIDLFLKSTKAHLFSLENWVDTFITTILGPYDLGIWDSDVREEIKKLRLLREELGGYRLHRNAFCMGDW